MLKISEYKYGSGDHTGECGIITYDKCIILQFINYANMQITDRFARFHNGKEYKTQNGKWIKLNQ